MRLKWIIIAAAVVAAGCVIAVVALRAPSDEELIKQVLVRAERGVESEEIKTFMSAFSHNYSDNMGLDYVRLKWFCREQFKQYSGLSVTISDLRIEVEGDGADVWMDMTVEARGGSGMESRGWDSSSVELAFAREGKHWRITRAASDFQ